MRVQHREEGANEPAGIFSYQDDVGGETLAREGKREGGEREEKDSFRIMADKDGVFLWTTWLLQDCRSNRDKRRTGCVRGRERNLETERESGQKRV